MISLVRDERFLNHDPGQDYPESPDRLRAIDAALNEEVEIIETEARMATEEEVLRAHSPSLLSLLAHAKGRSVTFDADTPTSPGSIDAAYLAAGATVDHCSRVATKEIPPGIALVRPPGHHATSDRPMGFCFLNNIAIAAHALLANNLAERVAIYDWDVHHGNGTEEIFYADDRVLYLSTHQHPLYPGTGRKTDTGHGKGEGRTLNVPLPGGTDDATLIAVSKEVLIPKVKDFGADVILISAGFDPYELDPIGGMAITVEGFRTLAGLWRETAETISDGKIAAVLEGGYHLEGLGQCVTALLACWDT